MFKIFPSIFALPLFFISCTSVEKNNNTGLTVKTNTVIKKDVPHYKNGGISAHYLLKDKAEQLAGFSTMENGFDSLKIRLWYGYVFSEKEQVVEISRIKGEWAATISSLTNNYYLNSDSVISVKKITESSTPKSGWPKFISKLFSLDILTLPDSDDIPGYNLPNDASGVNVQIATKDTYRFYMYASPKFSMNFIKEARQMEEIMQLIENELGFKRLYEF